MSRQLTTDRSSSSGVSSGAEGMRTGMSLQSRRLRNGLISLAIFFGLIVALLLAVPGLSSVADRISDANLPWLAVGIGLELLSCAGYVVLFDLVFGVGRRFGVRLSMAELAVNSMVSVSGAGGIALGAWVLHTKGMSAERITRRSVLLFVITSAVNVGAVVLIGIPMWVGLLPGSTNPLLTLLPAALALATIVAMLVFARWADRLAARHEPGGRVHTAMISVGEGVYDGLRLIRTCDWRLSGAVGYWLFDTLVLYVCLLAYGVTPEFWAVAMAYLVGLFANSIPLPGGILAVEGGLIGMLVLFGVRPASVVLAAVVTYRAISLWLPAAIGSVAFWTLRHDIGEPLPAPVREASSEV
ncbi:MAG: lysylphosphatidylglycerol synthase transmembrane domain-containing protein [Solirubrobacteraceae bacterium]